MVRDGLVRKSIISGEFGPSVLVWGITVHGAAMAARQNEPISARTFEPSKIKLATMSHSLDLQRLQLRAERSGWGWEPVSGEFSRSEAKYADAVAVRPDGQKVAVEVERTVKTCKRYAEILVAHLAARKEGKWDWVYYLSPEQGVRDRVERAFHEIRYATWQQRRMKIDAVHLKPFRFDTYGGGWPEAV